jgi:hypothetical protein
MRLFATQPVGGAELANPSLHLALQDLESGKIIHPSGQLLEERDDQCAYRRVTLRGSNPGVAIDIIGN